MLFEDLYKSKDVNLCTNLTNGLLLPTVTPTSWESMGGTIFRCIGISLLLGVFGESMPLHAQPGTVTSLTFLGVEVHCALEAVSLLGWPLLRHSDTALALAGVLKL